MLICPYQGISDGLKGAGFSPEIHDLNYFQDDYGLKSTEGDEDEDEDEEDDADDDGDDEDKDDGESDDIGGSEGYEIIEGGGDEFDDEN